jgi:uncharacterized membrane protein YdbT with pleckstrin-like domain
MLEIKNALPWEKVVMVLKVHWITYVILSSLVVGVIWISFILLGFFWLNALNLLTLLIMWMIFSVFLYIEWIDYELDVFIITNNRIIWMEQVSFLNRTVSETNLVRVQEVNSRTKWFFSNIFNYWDLSIQTAGSKVSMSMNYCPNVIYEARKVLNIVESCKSEHPTINGVEPNIS